MSSSHEVTVACIYRSNHVLSDYDVFFVNLELLLEKLISFKRIVVCCDFNIDLLVPSPVRDKLLNILNLFHLKNSVNSPTRVTDSTKSCIDNIFLSFDPQLLLNHSNTNTFSGLSDHSHAQVVAFPLDQKPMTEKIWTRSLTPKQIESFIAALSHADFSGDFGLEHVDDQLSSFYNTFLLIFNSHFPYKLITVGRMPKKKWMTKGIATSCTRKRVLFNQSLHNVGPNFFLYYRNYCKILKQVIRKAKRNYTMRIIRCAPTNKKSKVVWQVVRENAKLKTKPHTTFSIKKDDQTVSDPSSVAN